MNFTRRLRTARAAPRRQQRRCPFSPTGPMKAPTAVFAPSGRTAKRTLGSKCHSTGRAFTDQASTARPTRARHRAHPHPRRRPPRRRPRRHRRPPRRPSRRIRLLPRPPHRRSARSSSASRAIRATTCARAPAASATSAPSRCSPARPPSTPPCSPRAAAVAGTWSRERGKARHTFRIFTHPRAAATFAHRSTAVPMRATPRPRVAASARARPTLLLCRRRHRRPCRRRPRRRRPRHRRHPCRPAPHRRPCRPDPRRPRRRRPIRRRRRHRRCRRLRRRRRGRRPLPPWAPAANRATLRVRR